MNNEREQLTVITKSILQTELNYSDVRNATHLLSSLFCNLTGFDLEATENQQHIFLDSGLAVSPYAAAFCVTDMIRTRKYLQGIQGAIYTKLSENPGRPVIVFYAGCGPFATLLTPLTTVFSPAQLQMVLLDVNPLSLDYLQKIIHRFSMQEYILGIEMADAVHYTIPEKYKPDILVSETMKPGLVKEPQVSVISQLLSQCGSNTIVVPECIIIDACLLGNMINHPDAFQTLKTLLKFDAITAVLIKNKPQEVDVFGKGVTVTLNNRPAALFSRLVLTTTINIYGGLQLGFKESSLTIPVPVMEIATINKYPAQLLFQYQISGNPGFTVRLL